MDDIVDTRPMIICDTNIWYGLSDGRIDPEDIADKRLVGTFINGAELTVTKNLYSNFSQVRKAVEAFGKYASGCYAGSPVEHIKMISGCEPDRSMWADMEVFMNAMVMSPEPPNADVARRLVTTYYDTIKEEDQPFHDLVAEHRKQIESRGAHKRRLSDPQLRIHNKEWLKNHFNTTVLEGVVVDWTQFHLFISTFDEWLRQLSIQSSLLVSPNEWNDLLNLAYVSPGDLYWTQDYRRTTEFIHKCGCGHYLYQNQQNNNG